MKGAKLCSYSWVWGWEAKWGKWTLKTEEKLTIYWWGEKNHSKDMVAEKPDSEMSRPALDPHN
jgi:hypothetical protein